MIIDEKVIESIFPELDSKWEKVDDTSLWQWEDKDVFQQAGDINQNSRFWSVVECINNLEDTSHLTLLDMGCDVGLHSMVATQKFKKVIGIDRCKISCRRALTTKKVFTENGYNVSNFSVRNQSYFDYCDSMYLDDGIDAILWSTGSGLFREEFDVSKAVSIEKIIQYQKLVIIQPGKTENHKNNVIKFLQDCEFKDIEKVIFRYPTMKRNNKKVLIIGRK